MSECPHCRTFAAENEKLLAELAGMQQEKLKDTREKIALRGMLTRQRRAEDINRHVMAVAKMWKALCAPRSSIAVSGKNVEHIRTAFVHFTDTDLSLSQRRRLLYDCVRGYALRPYDAGYGRRTANPAGAVRRVGAAYIFASEERIEAGAGYYRLVQSKPLEWKMAAWRAAMDVEALWRTLAFEESQRIDGPRTPQPLNPAPPSHLLLDERSREPAAVEPQRSLFVIEGGKQAAA